MLISKFLFYNFIIFIPEFFLSIFFLSMLIFGVIYRKTIVYTLNNVIIYQLSLLFFLQLNTFSQMQPIFNGLFMYDPIVKFTKLFLIASTMIFFLVSKCYLRNQKLIFFEPNILILIALWGSMLLTMSYHFLSFYLSLEIQSLCFYILTLSQRKSLLSAEAALKYFILGSVASGLILFGISYLYGILGTLNFGQIFLLLSNLKGINDFNYIFICIGGFIFILIGIFFKIGAAPVHFWLPDVYEGSPNHITFFFSFVPKISFIVVLIRLFFETFYNFSILFEPFFLLVSVFSIIMGGVNALNQTKFKRLLAFSAISHIGFILSNFLSGTYQFTTVLFYFILYSLMNMNIWTFYLSIFIKNKPAKYITDFIQLVKYQFNLSILFGFNFFSMAGIPPLAGFFIKFFILFQLIKSSHFLIVFLIVLFSLISSFYYLRFVKILFFEKKKLSIISPLSKLNQCIFLIGSQLIIFFMLFPNYLLTYCLYLNLSFLL